MTSWRTGLGMLLLLLSSVPSEAQTLREAQAPRDGVAEAVRATQGLMVAAFPDLNEESLTWRVQVTESGHVIDAQPAVPLGGDTSTTPVRLRATVTLTDRGQLETAQFSGTLIEAVRSGSPAHRGDAGTSARFAPDDPTTPTRLVSAGVRQQLGMASVATSRYRDQAPEAPSEAHTWRVELDDATGGGVTLVLEPVEGRLLSVVRR